MTDKKPLTKRERIGRLIVGPRIPLPDHCIFTLEQLQDMRWSMNRTHEERVKISDALAAADAILKLDFVNDEEE